MRIAIVCWMTLGLLACSKREVNLENRTCDAGRCLAGYACHPETDRCVPTVVVDCDGGGVCPPHINTGDACPSTGSFIPCVDHLGDCSQGCRTCDADRTWSACSEPPDCQLGLVASCSTCFENCAALPNVGTASCVPAGDSFECVILSCVPGYVNHDQNIQTGCEYDCVPTDPPAEVCDGLDNNCDGFTDPPGSGGCTVFYYDADGDGFGPGSSPDSQCLCGPSGLYRGTAVGDCDDDPAACGDACYPGAPTQCDGYDNNCNGSVDVPGPRSCTNACGAGSQECLGASYGDCMVPPRPCGGLGICAGEQACVAGGWGECLGGEEPEEHDFCNGEDSNCDGEIDTGCEITIVPGPLLNPPPPPSAQEPHVTSLDVDKHGGLWVGTSTAQKAYHLPEGATSFSELGGLRDLPITQVLVDDETAWLSYDEPGCALADVEGCKCQVTSIPLGGVAGEYCTDHVGNGAVTSLGYGAPNSPTAAGSANAFTFLVEDANRCDYPMGFAQTTSPVTAIAPVSWDEDIGTQRSVYVGNAGRLRRCEVGPHPACTITCTTFHVFGGVVGDNVSVLIPMPAPASDPYGDSILVGSSSRGLAFVILNATNSGYAPAGDDPPNPEIWNTSNSGIPSNQVNALAIDGYLARIFVATPVGLGVLDVGSREWHTLTESDNLPSNNITSLAFDPVRRVLWIGTANGVARLLQGPQD